MKALILALFATLAFGQLATLGPDLRLNMIPACMLRDDVELTGADQRAFLAECSSLQKNISALGARLRAQQGQRPPTAQDIAEANRLRELLILKSCEQLDRTLTGQGRRILRQYFIDLEKSTTTIRLGGK